MIEINESNNKIIFKLLEDKTGLGYYLLDEDASINPLEFRNFLKDNRLFEGNIINTFSNSYEILLLNKILNSKNNVNIRDFFYKNKHHLTKIGLEFSKHDLSNLAEKLFNKYDDGEPNWFLDILKLFVNLKGLLVDFCIFSHYQNINNNVITYASKDILDKLKKEDFFKHIFEIKDIYIGSDDTQQDFRDPFNGKWNDVNYRCLISNEYTYFYYFYMATPEDKNIHVTKLLKNKIIYYSHVNLDTEIIDYFHRDDLFTPKFEEQYISKIRRKLRSKCFKIDKYNEYHRSIQNTISNDYNPNEIFNDVKMLFNFEFWLRHAEVQTEVKNIPNTSINTKNLSKIEKEKLSNIPITIINKNYFTTTINNHDYPVRGHFRLQPIGEKRTGKKLIWINDFVKHQYIRVAKKLKDEVRE